MARQQSERSKAGQYYEHAQQLIDEAASRDEMYDRLDALYDQSRADQAQADAENVQIVQMPYATSAIDLISDLASDMTLTITVPAAKETKAAKEEADLQEGWLHAVLSLNEQAQQRNLTADGAWLGAMRAQVVYRTLFDPDRALDKDNKIKRVPVVIQPRDARFVYTEHGAYGLEAVAEAWRRTCRDVRRLYPGVLKDEQAYPDDSLVEWVEYWTETDRVYYAGGEPIRVAGRTVVKHGLGCIPYAIGTGRTTPRHRPGARYRPMLAGAETLLRAIDICYSILTTAGHDSVTNSWGVFSDSYGPDAKHLDVGPDAVNYFGANDKVQPLQRAPLPPDFFQLLTGLIEAWQQSSFPFAMYGQLPGQLAGYAINLLTQAGRRPLVPIWRAIERAYEGAFRNACIIAREKVAPLVGDEIPLVIHQSSKRTGELAGRVMRRELALDVSRIGDDFDVVVQLSSPLPQDEAQQLRMAIEATKSGLISKQTALEKFKLLEDAVAELDRVKAELVIDQLAQLEGVKLATERGYIPTQLQLPAGWHAMPDGRIMPDVLMPQPQPQPQQPGMPGAAEMQALAPMMQQALPEMAQLAGEAPPMPQMGVG